MNHCACNNDALKNQLLALVGRVVVAPYDSNDPYAIVHLRRRTRALAIDVEKLRQSIVGECVRCEWIVKGLDESTRCTMALDCYGSIGHAIPSQVSIDANIIESLPRYDAPVTCFGLVP